MRSRRISISIRPPDTVRLSLPYYVPLSDAMKFLDEKVPWIEKSILKLKQKCPDTIIEMPYATRNHKLLFRPGDVSKITASVKHSEIVVSYPLEVNHLDDEVQQIAKAAIEKAWKIEAEAMLPERLARLAELFGFKYNRLTIKNTRSKWGSCSSLNDILLSIHLMRLPDELIDYIIIHELCHTIHKNHGEKFHGLLDRLTDGRHSNLRRELKKYHTRW